MSFHLVTVLAIVCMGLATYASRLSGLLLMRGVVVKGRLKAALDAVPPAVLMAVITPTVFMTGRAEMAVFIFLSKNTKGRASRPKSCPSRAITGSARWSPRSAERGAARPDDLTAALLSCGRSWPSMWVNHCSGAVGQASGA